MSDNYDLCATFVDSAYGSQHVSFIELCVCRVMAETGKNVVQVSNRQVARKVKNLMASPC